MGEPGFWDDQDRAAEVSKVFQATEGIAPDTVQVLGSKRGHTTVAVPSAAIATATLPPNVETPVATATAEPLYQVETVASAA